MDSADKYIDPTSNAPQSRGSRPMKGDPAPKAPQSGRMHVARSHAPGPAPGHGSPHLLSWQQHVVCDVQLYVTHLSSLWAMHNLLAGGRSVLISRPFNLPRLRITSGSASTNTSFDHPAHCAHFWPTAHLFS